MSDPNVSGPSFIKTLLWGGPTGGVTGCSTSEQAPQGIVVGREEFGAAWKQTEVDACEEDHTLNNVFDLSKTTVPRVKTFAEIHSLWANVARKVFGRDQFKARFKGLNPYQQDHAVAKLADRLSIKFWGKKISHIMSWSRHWFGCTSNELWGYVFPPQVKLGITSKDVIAVLNNANIEAGVMVDELEMPKGSKPGEIKITLIPASFESKLDLVNPPAQSVSFDKYVGLPSEKAEEGKYLIDLGFGIRVIYPENPPSRDEAGNIQITVQFTINESTAKICGSAIKERAMVVLYKPKYAEKPYKIAVRKEGLKKPPKVKTVGPPTITHVVVEEPERPIPPEVVIVKKKPIFSKIAPTSGQQGAKPSFTITGKRIPAGATVDFGPGTTALNKKVSKTKITGKISIASNATKGTRYITINGKATKLAFTVTHAPPPPKGVCDHLTHLPKRKIKECDKECGAMTKETERNECIEMYAEKIK
ncbi:MAG: hypothetical protein V3T21_03525 [Candidatus Margulisiibacteriota bacterium]